MEIFKLFESTISNTEPGHADTKDLRRDQLLGRYDEAIDTLKLLIRAKENEISYRRDLVQMLEKSKLIHDKRLSEARQSYASAKKHAPETLDLRDSNNRSSDSQTKIETVTPPFVPLTAVSDPPLSVTPTNSNYYGSQKSQASPHNYSNDLDLSISMPASQNRSSLDRRLSEFMKTFPNLTQTGTSQPSDNNDAPRTMPGYYTQQPITQQPPVPQQITVAPPPVMAMMRFPPPPMIQHPQQHSSQIPGLNIASQENYETADMDLSDLDESNNNNGNNISGGIIPMVAAAMQKGAGGKSATSRQNYITGGQEHYGNPAPASTYGQRMNTLPFDPSIMEPRLRDSTAGGGGSGSSRDRHSSSSERTASGGHWQGSGGIPGLKHERRHSPPTSSQSSRSSSSSKRR